MEALLVSAAMDLILVQRRASERILVNLGPLDRGALSLHAAIQMGRDLLTLPRAPDARAVRVAD